MADEEEVEQTEPLLDEPLDLPWETQGAEWEHYFKSSLREQLGGASMYNQWFGPPYESSVYYDFHVTDPPIGTFLRLIPGDAGASLLLVGSSEEAIEENRHLWLTAARSATERLGSAHQEFRWYAMVASEPVFGGEPQILTEGATVDEMVLSPSGTAYWEYKPDAATLDGTGLSWSSLVGIDGTDTGFNFRSAELKAARRVATLRSMLSVIFNERWVIKLSPLERKIPFPSSHDVVGPADHPPDLTAHAHVEIALPDWINEAWMRVVSEPDLLHGLAMYQEALEVWDGHPSLALVSLVAVVEGIGARYADLVLCDCCEACKAMIGAGKRFRKALKLVRINQEAKPLIDAYGPRSDTVHAGKLHGAELDAGAVGFGLTQFDPVSEFEMGLVDELREAARDTLLLGLKGKLPFRENS